LKKYIIVDAMNLFFRSIHVPSQHADMWTKVGFALHLTLMSANSAVRRLGGGHVVFCIEGRSWRREVFAPYKRTRDEARSARTEDEVEEQSILLEAYDHLITFLQEQTNVTVLHSKRAEGDDMVARWIALHPDDHHTIVSADSDFIQLLSPTVEIFNGITDELMTVEGIFDKKGKPIKDKKTKEPKLPEDPAWALFLKCIRGDKSDNVFSAYPGAREKGSKNKVGIREAFEDREHQGFAWNNFMLQRWVDHEEVEHKVVDDYNRNVTLIDLTKQPDHLKAEFDADITSAVNVPAKSQVGIRFLKFCGQYELKKLSDVCTDLTAWLNHKYDGPLLKETLNEAI